MYQYELTSEIPTKRKSSKRNKKELGNDRLAAMNDVSTINRNDLSNLKSELSRIEYIRTSWIERIICCICVKDRKKKGLHDRAN